MIPNGGRNMILIS